MNTHSSISTENTEMEAEQMITKELMINHEKNEKLTIV